MGKPVPKDDPALDPPGYSSKEYEMPDLTSSRGSKAPDVKAFEARALSIAQAQLGPIFQTGFVMWLMVPNAINLFSIIFMTTMGATPFRNLMNMGAVFAPVSAPGVNLGLPKLLYVLLNLAGVGVVAYKLRVMGLLPLTAADWVSLLPSRHPAEFSAGAQPLG